MAGRGKIRAADIALVRDQLHRIAAGEEPVNVMTGDY